MKNPTILHAGLYPQHRQTALDLKTGLPEAIQEAASLLEPLLPKSPVVLIPMPSHTGTPKGNMLLASAIAALHKEGTFILPDLRSLPHKSRHDAKHEGENPSTLPQVRMWLEREDVSMQNIEWCQSHGLAIFLLDDVADTGATLREASRITGVETALVLDITERFTHAKKEDGNPMQDNGPDSAPQPLKVTIMRNRNSSLFACAPRSLFQFEYREQEMRWMFWLRGEYDPDIFPGKEFPTKFFNDACRAKYFIRNGGPMYETVEIVEGEKYIRAGRKRKTTPKI